MLDRESLMGERKIFVGMITIDFLDRELLYKRIDLRVDIMMQQGLLSEVESLYREGLLSSGTASMAIGYKELVEYLEGKCSLEFAVDNLKLASRRYAKRQLTWFRHEKNVRVIYADNPDGSLKRADQMLNEALSYYEELLLDYKQTKGIEN